MNKKTNWNMKAFIIAGLIIFGLLMMVQNVSAIAWWNTDWGARQNITNIS